MKSSRELAKLDISTRSLNAPLSQKGLSSKKYSPNNNFREGSRPHTAPTTQREDNPTIPFPKDGVRLSVFWDFIHNCGGRNAVKQCGGTTADVSEHLMKPLTEGLSYCDWLRKTNPDDVGPAVVFISHAWKYNFLEVVGAIMDHFDFDCKNEEHRNDPTKNIIVWFDMFSNNQYGTTNLDFIWWSTTFKSAIQQFGHTVMILAPWDDPIPLTRAWCLFELYCTIATESKFEIAMTVKEKRRFIETVQEDVGSVKDMIGSIDVLRSDAWNIDDKRKIFHVVEHSVGFNKVNEMVLKAMRHWVVGVLEAEVEKEKEAEEAKKLKLSHTLGALYRIEGKYEQAVSTLQPVLDARRKLLGPEDEETLHTLGELAETFSDQGRNDLAEPLHFEALNIR